MADLFTVLVLERLQGKMMVTEDIEKFDSHQAMASWVSGVTIAGRVLNFADFIELAIYICVSSFSLINTATSCTDLLACDM